MNKELRRILELSGVAEKNDLVSSLYENHYDSDGKTVKGLEGPFKMKNGRTVHYNVNERKYYDAGSSLPLSESEAKELFKEGSYTPDVMLHARKGDETISIKLEGVTEIKPMATTLRKSGYEDIEYSDGEERGPVPGNDGDIYKHIDVDGDSEGDVEGSSLEGIKATIDRLCQMSGEGGELPDWAQEKLDQASDSLNVVSDYLAGETGEQDDIGPEIGPSDADLDIEKESRMESSVNERALSKDEKEKLDKLKKDLEGSAMHKAILDQYGKDKGEEVFYGKLTKMAKEGSKKKTVKESYNEPSELSDELYELLRKNSDRLGVNDDKIIGSIKQLFPNVDTETISGFVQKVAQQLDHTRRNTGTKHGNDQIGNWKASQEIETATNSVLLNMSERFVDKYAQDYTDYSMRQGERGMNEGAESKMEMFRTVYNLITSVAGGSMDESEAREALIDMDVASNEEVEELFNDYKRVKAEIMRNADRTGQNPSADLNAELADTVQRFVNQNYMDYTDQSMRRGERGMHENFGPNTVKKQFRASTGTYSFHAVKDENGSVRFEVVSKEHDGRRHGTAESMADAEERAKSAIKELETLAKKDKGVREAAESKEEIQKKIDDLQKKKVDTAGHGRRARIQDQIDRLKDKLKGMTEGKVRDVVDWSDVKDAAVKVAKKVHGKVDMKKVDGIITNAKKHKPDSTAAAVEMVQDMLQQKETVTEGQNTFGGWKKALKKKYGNDVEFEGDKDIAQAFVKKDGKRVGVGEWDGESGRLEESKETVTEGQNTFGGWKKALKKKYGNDVEFEGDKDIAQAFVKKDGKRVGVGEWDGAEGRLEEAKAVDATVFGGDAPFNAVDDQAQKDERTGRADRTQTKNKVPKEVMQSIDKRIKELKKSIERYDDKGYNEKSVKPNAIEALEQIKKNLQRGDHEGFMEAQMYFTSLMSPIWDMIPAQVVNYLAKGSDVE